MRMLRTCYAWLSASRHGAVRVGRRHACTHAHRATVPLRRAGGRVQPAASFGCLCSAFLTVCVLCDGRGARTRLPPVWAFGGSVCCGSDMRVLTMRILVVGCALTKSNKRDDRPDIRTQRPAEHRMMAA